MPRGMSEVAKGLRLEGGREMMGANLPAPWRQYITRVRAGNIVDGHSREKIDYDQHPEGTWQWQGESKC